MLSPAALDDNKTAGPSNLTFKLSRVAFWRRLERLMCGYKLQAYAPSILTMCFHLI